MEAEDCNLDAFVFPYNLRPKDHIILPNAALLSPSISFTLVNRNHRQV